MKFMSCSVSPRSKNVTSTLPPTFTLEDFVRATAHIPDVIDVMKTRGQGSIAANLQDAFAACLRYEWERDAGVSKIYLYRLLSQFLVAQEESDCPPADDLLALWAIMLASPFCCGDPLLNGTCSQQSSFISYRFVNSILEGSPYLSLRVFTHHNDVSLRLWEAGAVLSEYLLLAPHLVRDKMVVELGAGVGLTSLVTALCGARRVCATDYSAAALENLRFNFQHNQKYLENHCHGGASTIVTETFLDWEFCCSDQGSTLVDSEGVEALTRSSVLLAADVAYDETVIPCLVETIRFFMLSESLSSATPSSARLVLLAMTLRSKSTFEAFISQVQKYETDMSIDLVADGKDCGCQPLVFPTHFVQPRSDVLIYAVRPSGTKV